MELLHKDDIEELDYIMKSCFEKGRISADELKLPKTIKEKPDHYTQEKWDFRQKLNYYRKYFEILNNFDYAEVAVGIVELIALSRTTKTERFISNGGFKKLYEEQQREIEHKEILRKKDIDDAEISKFNRERLDKYESRSKWSVWVAIGSLILSALAIGISIYSMFLSQNPSP